MEIFLVSFRYQSIVCRLRQCKSQKVMYHLEWNNVQIYTLHVTMECKYTGVYWNILISILTKTHDVSVSRKQQRKRVQSSRLISNELSKILCNFQVYSAIFSDLQAFKTDLRSMSKLGNQSWSQLVCSGQAKKLDCITSY